MSRKTIVASLEHIIENAEETITAVLDSETSPEVLDSIRCFLGEIKSDVEALREEVK